MNQPTPQPRIFAASPGRLELLALAVILMLAAALRLGMPGAVEFKQDEANLSLLALDLAHGRSFPLLGIDSSVGIRNAPMNVYLLVPPYLFSSDPTLATQYIGLLNVAAVLLLYLFARRHYGPAGALIAALMYAAAPWAVLYSRKVWAQEMLPPFILLTIGTGLLGLVEGRRWAQWLHLPFLAITGQIHYVAFVLLPVTAYLLFVGRRRLTRAFYLSIGIAILLAVPYALGIAREASAVDLGRLLNAERGADETRGLTLSGQSIEYAILTVAGTDIHSLAGAEAYQHYLAAVPDAYPLFNALALAVIASAGWLAARTLRRPRDPRAPVDNALLLWLLVTPLVFSLTWTPVFTHYMIPIFPAAFAVLGAGMADLAAALRPDARRIFVALSAGGLVIVAALQSWMVIALLNFLYTYATPGGFGTPLGHYAPIREAILAMQPAQVLADLDGQYIGYNQEASVWNVLLYDVPRVRFLNDGIDVYPAQEPLFLTNKCDAPGVTVRYPARVSVGTGAVERCYALRTRAPLDRSMYQAVDAPRFANGAQIRGYRWQPEDGCLTVLWETDRPATGPKSDFFNVAVHFINRIGEKLLDADSFFWLGRYWQPGDVVLRRFCMAYGHERIPDIAGVRLGLYTYEDTPQGRKFYDEPLEGIPDNKVEIRFD